MNKLAVMIALFAVVGAVVANEEIQDEEYSQAVMPTDEREVSKLGEDHQIFRDLCIRTRDDVKEFLLDSANKAAAAVYTVFFQSAAESAEDILKVQHESVVEAEKLILEQAEPIDKALVTKDEAKEALEQTAESISLIQTLNNQVKSVLSTVVAAVKSELMARLALLRSELNTGNLKQQINVVCRKISYDLKNNLQTSLNEFKTQVRKSASKDKMMLMIVNGAEIDNVKCLTMSRVVTASKVCDLINLAGQTLFSLLGF